MSADDGSPLAGPVDLEINFYPSADGVSPLSSPLTYTGVALNSGFFAVTLSLDGGVFHQIFPNFEQAVWVEMRDATHDKAYPRQRLFTAPLAAKVPIDAHTLAFDVQGRLAVGPEAAPAAGQFLTKDAGGNLV